MTIDARRGVAMLARSLRGLLPAVVLRRLVRGRNKRSRRRLAHVDGGIKSQRPTVFTLAFILVAVFSVEVRADQQPVERDSVVLAPAISNWSSELRGGQWGWHLTKYGVFDCFFRIDGKTLLMLATDINATDNVIWDPLTGRGLHLNHKEYEKFIESHKDDRYLGRPIINTDQLFPLGDERWLQTQLSPPYTGNTCGINFGYYINILGKDQNLIRSFYVIAKLRHPITVMRDICSEDDSGPHPYRHPATFKYDIPLFVNYVALRDHSILIVIYDGVSTRITRLDETLRQHSSVGDHVFILDADPINDEFTASPRTEDLRFRYKVILKKIEELKAGGL